MKRVSRRSKKLPTSQQISTEQGSYIQNTNNELPHDDAPFESNEEYPMPDFDDDQETSETPVRRRKRASSHSSFEAEEKAEQEPESPTQVAETESVSSTDKKLSILVACRAADAVQPKPKATPSIEVKRPSAREVFTTSDESVALTVLVLRSDSENGRWKETFYPVTADIQPSLRDELRQVEFRVAQDQRGKMFLLPSKLVTNDSYGSSWSESALHAAQQAQGQWIRMKANHQTESYDITVVQLQRAVPEKDAFMPLEEAIEMALGNNLIDRVDHPVLIELGLVPLLDKAS